MKDLYQRLRAMRPENGALEIESVQEVFMRVPAGTRGELVFRIPLLPNGAADVSQVPPVYRKSWKKLGERLPIQMGNLPPMFVKPEEGACFLAVLLRRPVTSSGVYFSLSPR